jgi:hypothetical protein
MLEGHKGLFNYFDKKFPKLLLVLYKFVLKENLELIFY